jgi:pimeloyl-ACP methyl ester carboxylesterase
MTGFAQNKKAIYLIPGQGSDYRVYKNYNFPEEYEVFHIKYIPVNKNETMSSDAKRLSTQHDTRYDITLIGMSLGGMLATEITDIVNPTNTIVISSAKCRSELPFRYRMLKYIPFYKIFPSHVIKLGSLVAQPLVEPDRNNEKQTCKAMLKAKEPQFLKRSIHLIVNWDRQNYNKQIIHIHGTKDHTLPIRNVNYQHTITKGSHMMNITQSEKIYQYISDIL